MESPTQSITPPIITRPEPLGVVVVAEDDEATLELLCDNLTADRYDAIPAPSAADALRQCHFRSPDLLLLDIQLPDASGLDVLREIRQSDRTTGRYDANLPVIVLSGRASDTDRTRGLEAGAQDYVTKPVYLPELLARMRSVLRRHEGRTSGPIRIGDLAIDPSRREVCVDGREITLANKEYELLLMLASEPRRVFTKAELLRDIWGFRTMGRTRTLDSHASRLRRKLDPEGARFIANCWGVGYRLIPS
ncbi:MAG TPA: response regulator transcription factor [Solirubrobacterales bacterium]|nr:response regulator transcription factor [Solirubrobacterales bacterium]